MVAIKNKSMTTYESCRRQRLSRFNILENLLLPNNGFIIFTVAIAIVYGLLPLSLALIFPDAGSFGLLSAITLVSILAMWTGYRIVIFDRRFSLRLTRLEVSGVGFISAIWVIFITFIAVTMVTAESIPIVGAISGLDANLVSQQRGEFLKGREGIGILLLYLSTLMSTFVPYTIVLLYDRKSKYRHLALIIFLLYAVSFMVKALFLYVVLPMLVYLAIKNRLNFRLFIIAFSFSLSLLLMLTYISLHGDLLAESDGRFFSATFIPSDPFSYFIWRSIAVPIFTAGDTLLVHSELFSGEPLMGATSSLLSILFGFERINLERFVFEHQFGSWNEIANSNAVFMTDAFVNFGWIGVVAFGFFVGKVFRLFCLSEDLGFKALWINFAFLLFSGSLIGVLLSNWWIFLLLHVIFIKLKFRPLA